MPFLVMALAAAAVAVLRVAYAAWGPRIIVNGTISEPVGFYHLIRRAPSAYRRGMLVVFPVPAAIAPLVYGRGWMRPGSPFLKNIEALAGDTVCVTDRALIVDGKALGPVFRRDPQGRPLPRLSGCFRVPPGEFFPASGRIAESFDGRYFGALPLTIIRGEAKPLWTF